MKKRASTPDPQRPLCACGQPGFFQVSIDVQELSLARDAGMSARPYWHAAYRSGTKIETIMCCECVKANVSMTLTASARVDGKKVL